MEGIVQRRRAGEALSFVLACGVAGLAMGGMTGMGVWAEDEVPRLGLRPVEGEASSQSATGQFRVTGGGLELRSAFSLYADEVRGSFFEQLGVMGGVGGEVLPIHIRLHEPTSGVAGGRLAPRVADLGNGRYHLQIDVELGTGFRREEFRVELVRLMLAARVLAGGVDLVGERTAREIVPDWLHVGLVGAMDHRERGRPSALFATLLRSGKFYDVESLLLMDVGGLDGLAREIHAVSCSALVLALQNQGEGRKRLRALVDDLAVFRGGQKELLMKHFPGLHASERGLEKWWTLQLAALSSPGVFDRMSAEETEGQLQQLLVLRLPARVEGEDRGVEGDVGEGFLGWVKGLFPGRGRGEESAEAGLTSVERGGAELLMGAAGDLPELRPPPEGVLGGVGELVREGPGMATTGSGGVVPAMDRIPIEDLKAVLARGDRGAELDRIAGGLESLAQRAHPLWVPILGEYRAVVDGLRGDREGELWDVMRELLDRRLFSLEVARAMESHLDWYEATQRGEKSGSFDGFLRAMDELDARPKAGGGRLSRYLDAVEEILER
jgi:hypothetical protein